MDRHAPDDAQGCRSRHRRVRGGVCIAVSVVCASRGAHRRDRRRLRRRELRTRAATARSKTSGEPDRAKSNLYRLSLQQRGDRRHARASGATIQLWQDRRRRRDRHSASRRPRSIRRPAPSRWLTAIRSATTAWCCRPASTCASTPCLAMTKPPRSKCRTPGRPANKRCCCAGRSKPWRMAARW